MTNDEIAEACHILRGGIFVEYADLIEQLQRERDSILRSAYRWQSRCSKSEDELDEAYSDIEALTNLVQQQRDQLQRYRDRLAEMERKQPELINVGVHQAVEQARREGFHAGIEAAAEKARIFMLGLSKERSDKMQKAIRSLTPTDKAPSVADHDIIEFRGIGNYYGTLCLKRENGQDYWTIENYDGHDWAKIPDELGSALRALAAREGE